MDAKISHTIHSGFIWVLQGKLQHIAKKVSRHAMQLPFANRPLPNPVWDVYLGRLFFCAFWGKLVLPKNSETRFFTMKLDFFPRKLEFLAILSTFYITKCNLTQKFAWGDPFYCIFIIKNSLEKGKFYVLVLTYMILKKN